MRCIRRTVESSFSYSIPAGFRTRAGCRITPAGRAGRHLCEHAGFVTRRALETREIGSSRNFSAAQRWSNVPVRALMAWRFTALTATSSTSFYATTATTAATPMVAAYRTACVSRLNGVRGVASGARALRRAGVRDPAKATTLNDARGRAGAASVGSTATTAPSSMSDGAVAARESPLPKSCDRRAVASAWPIGGLNRNSTTRPPRRTATSSSGSPNRLKHVSD
jgi:hypothetical protein